MAIRQRGAKRLRDWGWVLDREEGDRMSLLHISEQKCVLCLYGVCFYTVCAPCYFVCVYMSAHIRTADKALIGWSEIHHGNYASRSSVHRSTVKMEEKRAI